MGLSADHAVALDARDRELADILRGLRAELQHLPEIRGADRLEALSEVAGIVFDRIEENPDIALIERGS